MSRSLRALSNPEYRLYFISQLLSMIGSWMQSTALSWMIYRLSHSAAWLGAVAFCSQLPAFLLAPVAGVLADRYDRKRILIWVQIAEMIQALLLAVLTFTNRIQIWQIAVLAVAMGLVTAFDLTVRHAFAVDVVGKKDLDSAIALNSVIVNLSRLLGPALGGIILGYWGEGWCFLINALSFGFVIWGLLRMKLVKLSRVPTSEGKLFELPTHYREVFSYLNGQPGIGLILAVATFISLVGFPYSVLLPVFAKDVLHGNERTLAWLTGMVGLGALTAVVRITGPLRKQMQSGLIFMGAGLAILGLSHLELLSYAAVFMIGYFMMGIFPVMNNTIQQAVNDQMRGRVMSLYTMTYLGAMPVGSLVVGQLAHTLGAPAVAVGCGALCSALGFWLTWTDLQFTPSPIKNECS